ncbi:hypothetical protein OAD61_00655 [bacterium]|nr:hypothetical protein [bacterium]
MENKKIRETRVNTKSEFYQKELDWYRNAAIDLVSWLSKEELESIFNFDITDPFSEENNSLIKKEPKYNEFDLEAKIKHIKFLQSRNLKVFKTSLK